MVRIVDDLLDVSRVTQGKISLQRERLDVREVVAQAVESSRPRLDARQHTVRLRQAPEPLPVSGDAARLAQVFENLLVNAAKYTPPGGTVTISVARERGEVAISVADTGIGIDPAMLRRVFDLFAQADTSLDRAEGGLGIGLTLAERLSRLHGGRIGAHSDGLGAGSTFTVYLPLLDAADAAADAGANPPGTTPRPRRVMIVDDNVDSAESLAALLVMNGHTVERVNDGHAAVAAAIAFAPDAVLLDISLPGIDGFEVLRRLRAAPQLERATIVAATGYGRDEDRARCLAGGFDGHLTKPVDLPELERLLNARVSRNAPPATAT